MIARPIDHPGRTDGDADMNDNNQNAPRHTIDPILADLWETKRQLNQEAGYQIPKLVEMARAAACQAGKSIPGASPATPVTPK